MREISDRLARAFDRVDDFRAVQEGSSLEEVMDAVLLLQQAVRIEDEARRQIRERLQELNGVRHGGEVLLGLIVGLFAAELGETKSRGRVCKLCGVDPAPPPRRWRLGMETAQRYVLDGSKRWRAVDMETAATADHPQ